jgi:hypothetical protein
MASNERQTEEARIRTVLHITSFDLTAFEHFLVQEGHIPDSADQEAVRNAVYKLRNFCAESPPRFQLQHEHLLSVSRADPDAGQDFDLTRTQREAEKFESKSAKYDAVRDFIRLIATRKAQASVAQQQQQVQGTEAAVKVERA